MSAKKERKIYVIGGDEHYCNWMGATEFVKSPTQADLVVLTGGADIGPALYGKAKHPRTYCNDSRDVYEVREFKYAEILGKPIIGICRGAQLLCAMAGGELVQDQDDPHYFHDLITHDGKKITMTSMHHQAMLPWKLPTLEYSVLAWTKGNSTHHDGPYKGVEMLYDSAPCNRREVEIAYFSYIRGLGIQGHPEMMWSKRGFNPKVDDSIKYCQSLLDRLIDDDL